MGLEESDLIIKTLLLPDRPLIQRLGNWLNTFLSGELGADRTGFRLQREDELVEFLNSTEFRRNIAGPLTARATLGKFRLPKIIPQGFSKEVVERFCGPLSDSNGLGALFVLMCSSIYYEHQDRKISARVGKRHVNTIINLFGDKLDQSEPLLKKTFCDDVGEIRGEIPPELVSILNNPGQLKDEFGKFFKKSRR